MDGTAQIGGAYENLTGWTADKNAWLQPDSEFVIPSNGTYTVQAGFDLNAGGYGNIDDVVIVSSDSVDARGYLKQLIKEVQDAQYIGVDGKYTSDTYNALVDAYTSANSIVSDTEFTENATSFVSVNNVGSALRAAIDGLAINPSYELKKAIDKAESYVSDNYTEESYQYLANTISGAKAVYNNSPTEAQCTEQIALLQEAIDALVWNATVSGASVGVTVERVKDISSDFIKGVDVSSYISIIESGAKYKDFDGNELDGIGFFKFLKSTGVNYVRLRMWNNPYDSNGNGYGGGNNDYEKTLKMGKLATQAGLRVLVDLHYSDFWADPAKQVAPKAWKGYTQAQTETAVYNFTYDTIKKLVDAGVDVGMVQVGNETNNGVAGVKGTKNMAGVFTKGVKAVHDVSDNILAVLHFTDPEDGNTMVGYAGAFKDTGYDVFATSYYPFWHGTKENLNSVLSSIAETYNKKVMVAETSYTTTWNDGDGHENTAPKSESQALYYDVSVQGQAKAIREVIDAVASIKHEDNDTTNGDGIGVFYWEPAWIPVNYAYNSDGSVNTSVLNSNKKLWEKYGSGWASSYSYEYDSEDAGLWYGGSAVDNQSFFDFKGNPLPSAMVWSYVDTGSVADKALQSVNIQAIEEDSSGTSLKNNQLKLKHMTTYDFSNVKATASYNDGTYETVSINWDYDELALIGEDYTKKKPNIVNATVVGDYTVNGVAKVSGNSYSLKLKVKVYSNPAYNKLTNGDFENGDSDWTIVENVEHKSKAPWIGTGGTNHTGSNCLNFWDDGEKVNFDIYQDITGLAAGNYSLSTYLQGGNVTDPNIYLYCIVNGITYKQPTKLSGYLNWNNPAIENIAVPAGASVRVGIHIEDTDNNGIWGTIDDFAFEGDYDVLVSKPANGSLVANLSKARAGSKIKVHAEPDKGYVLDYISQNGTSIKDKLSGNYYVITMPEGDVTFTAGFKAIAKNTDIAGNDVVLLPISDQAYTGSAITPAVIISYNGTRLTEDVDYKLSYANNKNVGTASVTIKGKGSFTGSRTGNFNIVNATNINKATVDKLSEYPYTGYEIEPKVTITYEGKTLSENTDYRLSYYKNEKVGTGYIYANGIGKYSGSRKISFKIRKCDIKKDIYDINNANLTFDKSATYTSSKIKPAVNITYGVYTLTQDKDYTAKIGGSRKVGGKAKLIISGKGNFKGKIEKEFTITAKALTDSDVDVIIPDVESKKNGFTKSKVMVFVNDYGKKLALNSDYTVTYNKTADNYVQVVITGKKNYSGSLSGNYYIVSKNALIKNMKKSSKKAAYYTGEEIEMNESIITFTNSSGEKMGFGTDYKVVKYLNNIKPGTATAYVKGCSDRCRGYLKMSFKIKKKTDVSDLVAEIYYDSSTSAENRKEFYTGYKKKPKIKVYDKTDGTVLEDGSQYKVSYKNNLKATEDTGKNAVATVTLKGTYKGKLTVSFNIVKISMNELTITPKTCNYTGSRVKPQLTFLLNSTGSELEMKKGTAYRLSLSNNKKVANATDTLAPTATITAVGMHTKGEKVSKTFTIAPGEITYEGVTTKPTKSSGGKVKKPSVKVVVSGRTLKMNRDYKTSLTYYYDGDGTDNDNRTAGKAYVTVTGIGNYTGSVTKEIIIL
ncbi:MAG: glycosyl hydrolase 53 family protein [Lachnospiraceae bacterium]|nr:glycosyl hydrolase 53 family protein [Lachnospiraceae bacterium]